MPARDLYHNQLKRALIKDGWTITHDPLRLVWGRRDLFVDLGAERLIAAEKASQRIAVEVKSFLGDSDMQELEQALGQFILYRTVLGQRDPDRMLYLAVPERVLQTIFEEPIGQLLQQQALIRLIGFDPTGEELVRWLPTISIGS
jgi:XisH protein